MAKQNSTFPYPYTIFARFDPSTKSRLSTSIIWSDTGAWMYPSVAPNAAGNLGGLINFGGGADAGFPYPAAAYWMVDDVSSFSPFSSFVANRSTAGPSGNTWWGHLTVRQHPVLRNSWIGASYYMTAGGLDANAVGHYSWFGRLRDVAQPSLNLPADIVASATGGAGAVVTYTVTATDPLDGSLTPSCTPPSGSSFPLGTTTVNCTATNKAGIQTTGSFAVTVRDITPPALSLPADMTVAATSNSGAAVSFNVTATDLVDGAVPVTCNPASGSVFPAGTTTVTCTATDKAGNRSGGSFRVIVTLPGSAVTTVSAASYAAAVAPESLASVFGQSLSNGTVFASLNAQGQLPTDLEGTTVTVDGRLAPLIVVSPSQINLVIPRETQLGTARGRKDGNLAGRQSNASGVCRIPDPSRR